MLSAALTPTSPDDGLAEAAAQAELVRASQGGSVRAFEDLVRLHTPRVFNFLFHMTRHRQDAEDLTQQTFVKAYQHMDRVDPERPLIHWLLTIARRTALNHFRAAKSWDELPATLSDTSTDSPAAHAEQTDGTGQVWDRARRLLSEKEYSVLWLRFGEELSTEETARIVGLTQPHVKILLFRARQRLMKSLKPA